MTIAVIQFVCAVYLGFWVCKRIRRRSQVLPSVKPDDKPGQTQNLKDSAKAQGDKTNLNENSRRSGDVVENQHESEFGL